jgi:hypothetical protein
MGCLVKGIDGLPALTNFGAETVVEKFIFCIGRNLKRLYNSISRA